MLVGVGYPDTWRDYSSLEVKRDDRSATSRRAEQAEYRPADSPSSASRSTATEWWMTPQTVNAVQPAAAERAQLPGRDPAAAVLRPEGRRCRQLRRDRRGDRPRDQPQLRQPGRRVRRRRSPEATGGPQDDEAQFEAGHRRWPTQYDAYEPLPGLHAQRPADAGREHRRCRRAAGGATTAYHAVAGRQAGAGDRRLHAATSASSSPTRRRGAPRCARPRCARAWSPTATRLVATAR